MLAVVAPGSSRPAVRARPTTPPWCAAISPGLEDLHPFDRQLVAEDEADPADLELGDVRTSKEAAFAALLRSSRVTTYTVGGGSRIPQHTHALGTLLNQPDARDALVDLFHRARTPAGKIWALRGLRLLDFETYEALRKPLLASTEQVRCVHYCMAGTYAVSRIARGLDGDPDWDALRAPTPGPEGF
jgi:hypothetical protein